MSNYIRMKSANQYYRDIFSRELRLGSIGELDHEILIDLIVRKSCDTYSLTKKLAEASSNLPEQQDKALKIMLNAIALANLASNEKWEGLQVKLPSDYIQGVINAVSDVLDISPNLEYLVASIQLLFKVGAIDEAISLIESNFSILNDIPVIYKILLLTCMFEDNYEYALMLVKLMVADSNLIGEDPLAMLMIVTTIFKNGGYPDDYIDFSSLRSKTEDIDYSGYQWVKNVDVDSVKPTVLIACDLKYYYEHAIGLIYSIYDTNKNNLNVHLHIYNIDGKTVDDVINKSKKLPEINISCTTESIGFEQGINVHYACRRFISANYLQKFLNRPLIIVDADCLIRKNWNTIKFDVSKYSVVLAQSENTPFWEKAIAGFVYLDGSEYSRRFIKKVSFFIWNNLKKGNAVWFLDQVALSAVMEKTSDQSEMGKIDASFMCDVNHRDNSFSWVVTTIKDAKNRYSEYKDYLLGKYGY
ncbi:hypothetical protein [Dickeya sp. ws52]|uniref:hypothetical protein n=1 Tax=Dickeya sp. ws52 TaxID=2576377 RepID=UPI00117D0062|nr:hypothetical protein [Dickeya sp. ws52]TYL43548.1 hypothetical protein FDP13_06260 [Dickeya sp. ws52]